MEQAPPTTPVVNQVRTEIDQRVSRFKGCMYRKAVVLFGYVTPLKGRGVRGGGGGDRLVRRYNSLIPSVRKMIFDTKLFVFC